MARRVPPHLASTPGIVWVIQPLKHVLVSGVIGRAFGKFLGQAKSSLAEIFFQPQSPAAFHKLLTSGVEAGNCGHGPPVDPGQVPLLLLGQGPTIYINEKRQTNKWKKLLEIES